MDPFAVISSLRKQDPRLKTLKVSSLLPARALAAVLAETRSTKILILSGLKHYTESEICMLLEALSCNSALHTLDVSDMRLSEECLYHVADLVRHSSTLYRLDVSGNHFTEDAAAELGNALQLHESMRVVIMRDADLGDTGAEAFMDQLGDGQCTLHKLDITSNRLTLKATRSVARFVELSTELTNVLVAQGNAITAADLARIKSCTERNIARIGSVPLSRPTTTPNGRPQQAHSMWGGFGELGILLSCEGSEALPNLRLLLNVE